MQVIGLDRRGRIRRRGGRRGGGGGFPRVGHHGVPPVGSGVATGGSLLPAGNAIGAAGAGTTWAGATSRSERMYSTIAEASAGVSAPWYDGITGAKPAAITARGSIIDSVRYASSISTSRPSAVWRMRPNELAQLGPMYVEPSVVWQRRQPRSAAIWWPRSASPRPSPLAPGSASGERARSEEHTSELQSRVDISYATFFF